MNVIAVYAGPTHQEEFAWLRVPEGAKGGPLDVMARERMSDGRWRTPSPGERLQIAAWVLDEEQALELELDPVPRSWSPPKPLPDLWLWLRG
ncbi:MAG: hypothetical protein QM572_02145 [Nocardioides sp.]|uniref:hypothetical protein n=1 Tax=Nocardioides sp. TaxID=35761 RepID=UPI0039E3A7B5